MSKRNTSQVAVASATASILLISSVSPALAADTTNWSNLADSYTNMGSSMGMDSVTGASGMSTTAVASEDGDNDIGNGDLVVSTPEVKKGNVNVGNTDDSHIDSVLYVYGDLVIGNGDLTVKGKLKVTGNLVMGNGDLVLQGGSVYVLGKKKFSNGSQQGSPAKLDAEFAKYDPYLKADLDDSGIVNVKKLIAEHQNEMDTLKAQLKEAAKTGAGVSVYKNRIRDAKQDFFADMKQYIQEEDLTYFEAFVTKAKGSTEEFLKQYAGKLYLSEKVKTAVSAKVDNMDSTKKGAFLSNTIAKVETLLGNKKISPKLRGMLLELQELLQDKLDDVTVDDLSDSGTVANVVNSGTTTSATGTTVSTGTGSTTVTAGTGTTVSTGTGTAVSATGTTATGTMAQ